MNLKGAPVLRTEKPWVERAAKCRCTPALKMGKGPQKVSRRQMRSRATTEGVSTPLPSSVHVRTQRPSSGWARAPRGEYSHRLPLQRTLTMGFTLAMSCDEKWCVPRVRRKHAPCPAPPAGQAGGGAGIWDRWKSHIKDDRAIFSALDHPPLGCWVKEKRHLSDLAGQGQV